MWGSMQEPLGQMQEGCVHSLASCVTWGLSQGRPVGSGGPQLVPIMIKPPVGDLLSIQMLTRHNIWLKPVMNAFPGGREGGWA